MTQKRDLDYLANLQVLAKSRVDFIIVGGVSAVLHGAPLTTFDLDLVPSLDAVNLDRLYSCLQEIHAIYRGRGDQKLVPERSHLSHGGHMNLLTDHGPLDVLGYIGKGWNYEKLLEHSLVVPCENMELRVLDLATLIQIKQETAREKDKAVISLLQAVLREKNG